MDQCYGLRYIGKIPRKQDDPAEIIFLQQFGVVCVDLRCRMGIVPVGTQGCDDLTDPILRVQYTYFVSQRFFSRNAASFGCLFLVKMPFLLPLTRMMPSVVWKSAKFHTSSPWTKS